MRLRPPRGLTRPLVAFSRHGHILSQHTAAHPATHRYSRIFFSTVQPASAPTSTTPPASPPPLTPAASLLTAFRAHRPPSPLPSSLLASPALLSAELRLLHRSLPFFVGFSSQLPLAGSHFTVECGGVSVIVIRGEDGVIRALFNNCTHQNARICLSSRPDLAVHSLPSTAPTTASTTPLQSSPTCHYSTQLVCPFHHWTFGLDGRHLAPRTPLTRDAEQRKAFALRRATVEEVDGLLWVRMKVETAEKEAAVEVEEAVKEVAEARRTVQQRLAGLSQRGRGSTLLQHNWKSVLAALSQQDNTLTVFPSAVYTQQPAPLLLQLLPLTEQLTAVTVYGVGTEAEVAAVAADTDGEAGKAEWEEWLDGVLIGSGVRPEQPLSGGPYSEQYRRLMVKGLSAEVAAEEKQRKDVEARRNKLLSTQ